jgi:excisionase family DNA binding protein
MHEKNAASMSQPEIDHARAYPTNRQLLTAQELAAALKTNHKDLYRMAAAGRIPSYKIGSSRRFLLEEVLAVCRDLGPEPSRLRRRG